MPNSDSLRLRVFDHPNVNDRYTVVFDDGTTQLLFVGMNDFPFHPAGFCEHGQLTRDWLESNAASEIAYAALPEDCRKVVEGDLREYHITPNH